MAQDAHHRTGSSADPWLEWDALPIVIDVREPPANDAGTTYSGRGPSGSWSTDADGLPSIRSEADALARAAYRQVQRFLGEAG